MSTEPPPATLSKGHAVLIEAIYRFVRMMATLKRNELLDAQRRKELCDLVAAARRTMAEILDDGFRLSRPGTRHPEQGPRGTEPRPCLFPQCPAG